MKVVIAGASGFIGKALVEEISSHSKVIALSRSKKSQSSTRDQQVEWRSCDLFSLLDAEKALAGADIGIYLVHSMRPNAHLTQGTFADFDLIVADNFVRAAKKNNLKQLIFLGGLCPEGARRESKHLQSRYEVEEVFKGSGIPYTILRAALILGGEGSSYHIMSRLVDRLPVMLCPSWSQTLSQPIALSDVVRSLSYVVNREECFNHTYDLGGETILSYRDMMVHLARVRGKRRILIPIPFMTPGWSSLWVSLITGAPRDLVDPLIEGLKTNLVARPEKRLRIPGHEFLGVHDALLKAVENYDIKQRPHAFSKVQSLHEARSVQRLPMPAGWGAHQVAQAYMEFLPKLHSGLVKVEVQDPWIYFANRWPYLRLLVLQYSAERSWKERQLFYVKGGFLSQKVGRGRLEFREVLGGRACIAAIHDFRPRLPWPMYKITQAVFHLWVMNQFGRFLAKKARREIQ